MKAEFPEGTPVFIWGRPEANLILLFGEGVFAGFNNHLYPPCPVVRLNDGRELSIHYTGVNIGERNAVKEQCSKFKGDIIEWELERFLRRDLPSLEQRSTRSIDQTLNGAPLPPPKTATDKVLYLKREIQLERLKIEAREKEIAVSKKKIEEKRAELALIKDAVMAELSSIDDVDPDALAAAEKRLKSEVNPAPVAPILEETVEIPQDVFHKLATED